MASSASNVVLRVLGEVVEGARTADVLGPPGELLVDRQRVVEVALRGRDLVVAHTVDVVGDADRDALDAGEGVELGEHEVGDAVDACGVAGDGCVVPAGATGAAGGGAELETALAQEFTPLVEQLRRERACADARGVGLHDADDAVDAVGADARTGGRASRGRVGGRDERVGAVVHVEHGGLAALEQHVLAVLQRLVQQQRRVDHHGPQPLGVAQQVFDDLIDADRAAVVDLHQQVVLLIEGALHLLPQDVLVEEVLDADADTVDLVGVGGADAAAGRADLALAEEPLGDLVDRAVVLGDHVRVGADLEA